MIFPAGLRLVAIDTSIMGKTKRYSRAPDGRVADVSRKSSIAIVDRPQYVAGGLAKASSRRHGLSYQRLPWLVGEPCIRKTRSRGCWS
jgi:hypothetical protein